MSPKAIALLVLIFLFLIVFFQNIQPVSLRVFFWRITAPQIILLPFIMLIGFALGYAVAKLTGRPRKNA
jgi:uncharacterized integral membrane protein